MSIRSKVILIFICVVAIGLIGVRVLMGNNEVRKVVQESSEIINSNQLKEEVRNKVDNGRLDNKQQDFVRKYVMEEKDLYFKVKEDFYFGAEPPLFIYGDQDKVMLYNSGGVFVFDLTSGEFGDALDIGEFGSRHFLKAEIHDVRTWPHISIDGKEMMLNCRDYYPDGDKDFEKYYSYIFETQVIKEINEEEFDAKRERAYSTELGDTVTIDTDEMVSYNFDVKGVMHLVHRKGEVEKIYDRVVNDLPNISRNNSPYSVRKSMSFAITPDFVEGQSGPYDERILLDDVFYEVRLLEDRSKEYSIYSRETGCLIDRWRLEKFYTRRDFDVLTVGESILDDVVDIDPYTGAIEWDKGYISEHRLENNESLIIYYKLINGRITVDELEYHNPDPSDFWTIVHDSKKDVFEGIFRIGGSTSAERIAVAIVEQFISMYNKVDYNYEATGSTSDIERVSNGELTIGFVSREVREDEKNIELTETVIAYDAIAVVINPLNPVIDLTKEEIRLIFMGEITNWSEVGGNDLDILVVIRPEGSGCRGVFNSIMDIDGIIAEDALVADGGTASITKVSSFEGAISYDYFGSLDETIKAVSIDGIEPTNKNVIDGFYPIVRKCIAVYQEETLSDIGRAYLDYALSIEGQSTVERNGSIPLYDIHED